MSTRAIHHKPWWWFHHADKVIHIILFGLLAHFVYFALRQGHQWRFAKAALVAFLAATLYGSSDEIHQRFTPTRSSDLADVGADALGAASVFFCGLCRARKAPGEEQT